ncbi:hypothetical protein ACFSUS_11380 [Spirosoma soli]|uniref:Restriction endonuclease subunit R n=1 Tax=Spirosoma soli TaxID=1770529 RepID=A0ABW5M6D3_9BACT
MAYRNFRFADLSQQFGIRQTTGPLFSAKPALVEPSAFLLESIRLARTTPLTTEKAVSEALVFPVLREIKIRNADLVELFSGENLEADRQRGLNGECDFIFTKTPGAVELQAPILTITEAKRGDIENPRSLAQAAAQLCGARIFNQNHGQPVEMMYGFCTSGYEWVALQLTDSIVTIDSERYSIQNLPQLLGILQHVLDLSR